MTDPDDAISRRYRESAREEPPAALDAAILAASRRAVGAGPRRNRWAVPLSLAAVLMLGVGIALRLQVEQPGIETAAPEPSSAAEYPLPATAEPAPAAPPAEQGARPAELARDARKVAPARKAVKPPDLPPEAAPQQAPAPLADHAEPQARREMAATITAPVAVAPPPTSPAPAAVAPPPPAPAAAASAPAELRARRAETSERAAPKDPREAELERIAKLRAAGRHEEADKALESFRREHPQYRIPDALRERVERR